jgi:hypothetical protein
LQNHLRDLEAQIRDCNSNREHCNEVAADLRQKLDEHVTMHPPNLLPKTAQLVLKEIITSERIYVDNLTKVNNVTIPHLVSLCGVSTEKIQAIFTNWDRIALASSHFLVMLLEEPGSLVNAMEAFRNYSSGMKALNKLKEKDPRIKRYVESVKLNDALILPVQRLPRYVLLLTELANKVQPTSKTLVMLVLSHVKALVAQLNDQLRL